MSRIYEAAQHLVTMTETCERDDLTGVPLLEGSAMLVPTSAYEALKEALKETDEKHYYVLETRAFACGGCGKFVGVSEWTRAPEQVTCKDCRYILMLADLLPKL